MPFLPLKLPLPQQLQLLQLVLALLIIRQSLLRLLMLRLWLRVTLSALPSRIRRLVGLL